VKLREDKSLFASFSSEKEGSSFFEEKDAKKRFVLRISVAKGAAEGWGFG
jgi:hypothetical protein